MKLRPLFLLGILSVLIIPFGHAEDSLLVSSTGAQAGTFFTIEDGPYPTGCPSGTTDCGEASSFLIPINSFLTRVQLQFRMTGTPPSGTVLAHIYNTDTQTASSAKPDGTTPIEASDTMAFSEISSSSTLYSFNFSGTTRLTANTVYAAAIVTANTTSFGAATVDVQSADANANAAASIFRADAWTVSGDIVFNIYGISTPQSSLRDGAYFLAAFTGIVGIATLAGGLKTNGKEVKKQGLLKTGLSMAILSFFLFIMSRLF